jgi:hypothetical protein
MFERNVMKIISLLNICCGWVVLAGLAACGGGGGGGASVTLPESANVVAPVPTRIMGLYSSGSGIGEIVSVVTPELDFFALYFRSVITPDIFSGKLDLGINGAANSTSAGLLFNVNNGSGSAVSNVTASFTDSSLQTYTTSLFNGSLQRLSSPADGVYLSTAAAVLGNLQGTWSGSWKGAYGSSVANLTFSNTGTSSASTLNYCQIRPVITVIPNTNIFKVTMAIPNSLNCARGGDSLTGVGVIYKSPLAGKNERLDLVAVDAAGSGISFRGDR